MSLITRCPACATLFRVVPDQLRISDGWVRCGQCAEIFDATQQLVTPAAAPQAPQALQTPAPPPLPPSLAPTPDPVPEAPAFADTLMAGSEAAQYPMPDDDRAPEPEVPVQDADPVGGPRADAAQSPAVADAAPEPAGDPANVVADEAHAVVADTAIPGEAPAATSAVTAETALPPEPVAAPPAEASQPPPDAQPAADVRPAFARLTLPSDPIEIPPAGAATPAPAALPSFMRHHRAHSDSVWQRPPIRTTLRVLAPLLCVALALQVVRHERDRIVAFAPDARPVLEQMCAWSGCTLSPLRRIEAIVIDGSSFGRVRDNLYRLSIGIRNTASLPVLLPSIELALTNPQAQTLVRRVIDATEFGTAPESLAPGAEWNGALMLRIDASPAVQDVAGYGLFAFYP